MCACTQSTSIMEQISHEGIAESVNGNYVKVRIVQGASCAGCSARSACMAAETAVKYVDAVAAENGSIREGDNVTVSVSKRLGWKAVLLAFVLPFVVVMTVLAVLVKTGTAEYVAGLIALCSLAPYYTIIYLLRDRLKAEYRFEVIKQ